MWVLAGYSAATTGKVGRSHPRHAGWHSHSFLCQLRRKRQSKTLTVDGESTASLHVSRKERGTVLEGSHLLNPPRQVCPTRAVIPSRALARGDSTATEESPPSCARSTAAWRPRSGLLRLRWHRPPGHAPLPKSGLQSGPARHAEFQPVSKGLEVLRRGCHPRKAAADTRPGHLEQAM